MAYTALVSLSHTIDQILNHHIYSVSLREKQQMISIHDHTIFLQVFFEDFTEKVDDSLEGRIRDVANQAEDMIEYLMLEQIRSSRGLTKSTVRPSGFKFIHYLWDKHTHIRYDFRELVKVSEKIQSIAAEVTNVMNRVKIEGVRVSDRDPVVGSSASSSSRLSKDAMVGFDDRLLAMKELLCGESTKLQVIPIVGMGGIGKTTLATNAYHDPLIIECFHIRAWVTVSQDYSAKEVFSDLRNSMKEFSTERYCGERDEEKVYKILKGRKYLIVVDDMWSTQAWDDIKRIFPDDNNGSRIMLTTRLSSVGAYADSSSPLQEMHLMDNDQSWDLLQHKVFTHEDCPHELKNIGKEIARGCGGLPLAIVVIGGLLSTVSKTRASWEEVAENVKSAINTTKDGQIGKILSLSYTHLPHHLRPCLLYMGAFPEDHEIHVSELIRFWIAEGFIRSSVCRTFEEVAEEYLEDLVKRNLVSVSRKKFNGKIKSCRLHDLMRELCIRISQQEKFLLHVMIREVPKKSVMKNQRRICITQSHDLNCLANIYGSTIRTILSFRRIEAVSVRRLKYFRFLRILDFDHVDYWLPAPVLKLFHLRYLALKSSFRIMIQSSISNLKNLQTLIICPRTRISGEPQRIILPHEIWQMPQLRHLICFNFDQLPHTERSVSALENLHTLSAVSNLICAESLMKRIPNVKKLVLYYYTANTVAEGYHLENLVHLKQLEKLKITASPTWKEVNPSFPKLLKELTLSCFAIPLAPMMSILGSFPDLQVLKLRMCDPNWIQWATSEGEFLSLQYLLIQGSKLKEWITEGSHFPSLKCLLLHSCWDLTEIPNGVGEIPTLELIEVKRGNKSLEESARGILEEQRSWGNDVLQVRCLDSMF